MLVCVDVWVDVLVCVDVWVDVLVWVGVWVGVQVGVDVQVGCSHARCRVKTGQGAVNCQQCVQLCTGRATAHSVQLHVACIGEP